MDFFNKNVSVNLRRIRKSKQLSLDNVAQEMGISKSMIGQIERGEVNPAIGAIGKIISRLQVNFMDLTASPKEESYLVHRQTFSPVEEEKGDYSSYVYFPYKQGRNFEIYGITIEQGKLLSVRLPRRTYDGVSLGLQWRAFSQLLGGR